MTGGNTKVRPLADLHLASRVVSEQRKTYTNAWAYCRKDPPGEQLLDQIWKNGSVQHVSLILSEDCPCTHPTASVNATPTRARFLTLSFFSSCSATRAFLVG